MCGHCWLQFRLPLGSRNSFLDIQKMSPWGLIFLVFKNEFRDPKVRLNWSLRHHFNIKLGSRNQFLDINKNESGGPIFLVFKN